MFVSRSSDDGGGQAAAGKEVILSEGW